MIKTFGLEKVAKEAEVRKAIEIAKKLLKKGLLLQDVADSTDLDIETVEELREKLEQTT